MRRWSSRLPALLLALTLTPIVASAHPLDEVVQTAYLTLAPGEVSLELDVTPGSLVSGPIRKALDADGDHVITEAEARAYGDQVLAASSLTLDGFPATWRLVRVEAPPYDHLQAESEGLKIYAVALRPPQAGARLLSYENRYAPAKTEVTANIFLHPAGGWRYRVTGQRRSEDGRRLTVAYSADRN